jgi:23S rRNA (cytosine1962-C5)-methyltransferase
MKPRRYQLRKEAVAIIERGHPWIFREQMSSAAAALQDGDVVRLFDAQNRVVGYGLFEAEGAIAIRVLRRGPEAPNAAWVVEMLDAALAKRAELASRTDGIRLVHGESDGLPAVVVDRFGDTLVVSSYSTGADAIARFVAQALVAGADGAPNANTGVDVHVSRARSRTRSDLANIVGPASHVVLRPARRRRGPAEAARVLRGTPPDVVWFAEDDLRYAVDLAEGHKTGTYLDLRGLRRYLASSPRAGARVLNLFAYTGMLGRAAEHAGAAAITHVDQSQRALDFAAAHHTGDPAKHTSVCADVFAWLPELGADKLFDVVIVDPPAMTSKAAQIPNVLAAYRKLYRAAERHVAPGGLLVSACCTSRIERKLFKQTVRSVLPERFTLERDIPPEPDHPVGFAQADYLKILCWRAAER